METTVISRTELKICSKCGDLLHIPLENDQTCPRCTDSELLRVSLSIFPKPEKRKHNLSSLPTIDHSKIEGPVRKDSHALRLHDMNNCIAKSRL
jgi:hypothetical protein